MALSYEELGEQVVKNIAEPVRAYRVKRGSEGHPASSSVPPAQQGVPIPSSEFHVPSSRLEPTPNTQLLAPTLVGREVELTQLQNWFDRTLRGERQLVFITGEAGIGKTTLVEAFVFGVRSDEECGVEGREESQKSKGKGQKAKVKTDPRPPIPDLWLGRGQCIEQYGAGEPYMPILEALGRLCREAGGERLIALLHQHAPTWLVISFAVFV